MGLKTFLLRGRLQRLEREEKRLHHLQRRVRDRLEDLAGERKKGALDAAAFEAKRAKLEQERHQLVEKLKAIEAQARALRAELRGAEAAA